MGRQANFGPEGTNQRVRTHTYQAGQFIQGNILLASVFEVLDDSLYCDVVYSNRAFKWAVVCMLLYKLGEGPEKK